MSDISHVLRTVEELGKRVEHLEEENKQLKRQLRPSTANPSYADRGGNDGDIRPAGGEGAHAWGNASEHDVLAGPP